MAIHWSGDDNERDGVYDDAGFSARSSATDEESQALGVGSSKTTDKTSTENSEESPSTGSGSVATKTKKTESTKKGGDSASEERSGLYSRAKSGAAKSKKLKGKGKKGGGKKIGLLILSTIGLPSIAIFILLYTLTGFSLENMVRISNAYRFATAHRHLATITRQILVVDSVLSPESKAAPRSVVGGTSLMERFRNGGWTPEKALRSLGAKDVKLTFDSNNRLVSMEQARVGERRTITLGDQSLDQWSREVGQFTDSALNENGRKRFHRRKTVNFTRSTTGAKLTVFKRFLEARDERRTLSTDDGKQALLDERIDRSRGDGQRPRSTLPGVEDSAAAQVEDARNGTVRKGHRLTPGQITTINAVQNISQYAFYMTLYCIANQVANGIEDAIEQRVGALSRFSQGNDTAVDQFHAGDATQEALRATDAEISGYQKSQAYAMGTGRAVETVREEDMLATSDLPLKVGPFSVQQIQFLANMITEPPGFGALGLIPGVSFEGMLERACGYILNPVGQAAVAVIDTFITLVTLGSSEVLEQGIGRAIARIVVTAVGVSLGLELILDMFSSITDTVAGLGAVTVDGQEFANKDDVGRLINKNAQFVNYANTLPADEAVRQARQGVEEFQRDERSKGALYAYFSPNNPFSLTSSFITPLPRSLSGFSTFIGDTFNNLLRPSSTFSSLFSPAGATHDWPPEMVFYEMEDMQVGFTQGQVDGSDPRLSFLNVVNTVEAELPRYKTEYGECIAVDVYDYALNGVSDNCNSSEGGVYKMYFAYCDAITAVSRVGSAQDSYATEDCLDLAGSSRSKFKLSSGSSSPGGSGGGVADLAGSGLNVTGPTYPCIGNGLAPVQSSGEGNDWSDIVPTGDIGTNSDGQLMNVYIRESCDSTDQKTVLLVGSIHGGENAGQRVAHEMLFSTDAGVPRNVRVIAIPELCNCAGTGRRATGNLVNGLPTDLSRNFDFGWESLNATQQIGGSNGNFYSKGSAPFSAVETAAFKGFADEIATELDLAIVFHSGLTYVAGTGDTPPEYASSYSGACNCGVPVRSNFVQSGSLYSWINGVHEVNALLVEMGTGSSDTESIPGHVQGVISAISL